MRGAIGIGGNCPGSKIIVRGTIGIRGNCLGEQLSGGGNCPRELLVGGSIVQGVIVLEPCKIGAL